MKKKEKKNSLRNEKIDSKRHDSSADISFSNPCISSNQGSASPSKTVPKPSPKMSFTRRKKVMRQFQKSKTPAPVEIEDPAPSLPTFSKWMFYDIPEPNLERPPPISKGDEYKEELGLLVDQKPELEAEDEMVQDIPMVESCDTPSKETSFPSSSLEEKSEEKSLSPLQYTTNVSEKNSDPHPANIPDTESTECPSITITESSTEPSEQGLSQAMKNEIEPIYHENIENMNEGNQAKEIDAFLQDSLTINKPFIASIICPESEKEESNESIEVNCEAEVPLNGSLVHATTESEGPNQNLLEPLAPNLASVGSELSLNLTLKGNETLKSTLFSDESEFQKNETAAEEIETPNFSDRSPQDKVEDIEVDTLCTKDVNPVISSLENKINTITEIPSDTHEICNTEKINNVEMDEDLISPEIDDDYGKKINVKNEKNTLLEVEIAVDIESIQVLEKNPTTVEEPLNNDSSVKLLDTIDLQVLQTELEVSSMALEGANYTPFRIQSEESATHCCVEVDEIPTFLNTEIESQQELNEKASVSDAQDTVTDTTSVITETQSETKCEDGLSLGLKETNEEGGKFLTEEEIIGEEKDPNNDVSFNESDLLEETDTQLESSVSCTLECLNVPSIKPTETEFTNDLLESQISSRDIINRSPLTTALVEEKEKTLSLAQSVIITEKQDTPGNASNKCDALLEKNDMICLNEANNEEGLSELLLEQSLSTEKQAICSELNENMFKEFESPVERKCPILSDDRDCRDSTIDSTLSPSIQNFTLEAEPALKNKSPATVSFQDDPIVIQIDESEQLLEEEDEDQPKNVEVSTNFNSGHVENNTVDVETCISFPPEEQEEEEEEEEEVEVDVESELTKFSDMDPSQIYSHDLNISTLVDDGCDTDSDPQDSDIVLLTFEQNDTNNNDLEETSTSASMDSETEQQILVQANEDDNLTDAADTLASIIASELLEECPSHPFNNDDEENSSVVNKAEYEYQKKVNELIHKIDESLADAPVQDTLTLEVDIDQTSYTLYEEKSSVVLDRPTDSENCVALENQSDESTPPLSFIPNMQLEVDCSNDTSPKSVFNTVSNVAETDISEDMENQISFDNKHDNTDLLIKETVVSSFSETKVSIVAAAAAAEDEILTAVSQNESPNTQSPSIRPEATASLPSNEKTNIKEMDTEPRPRGQAVYASNTDAPETSLSSILSTLHQPGMPPALEITMHLSFFCFITILIFISYFTWGTNVSYYALFLTLVNVGIWLLTATLNSQNRSAIHDSRKKND